jgi:hypothetical protein
VSQAQLCFLWRHTWGVKTSKKRCNSSSTITLNTSWYVHSTIFFCKLLFSWIEFDDFLFNFQETFNNRLRERYGDDHSTHLDFDPNLWMEAGLSSVPDRNRVYGIINTMTENLQATRSVSTIGSSESVSSTQSQQFVALQQHTTCLTEKYEQLSADYEQRRQMFIDIRSQMSGTCASPFWPYGPGNDQPPPPTPPLFYICHRRRY